MFGSEAHHSTPPTAFRNARVASRSTKVQRVYLLEDVHQSPGSCGSNQVTQLPTHMKVAIATSSVLLATDNMSACHAPLAILS